MFFCLTSAASTPAIRAVEAEFAPKLAAHPMRSVWIRGCSLAWTRSTSQRQDLGLAPEAVRLVERLHTDFTLAGARLDEAGREELRRLNQEIAIRCTQFEQTLVAATESSAVLVIDRANSTGWARTPSTVPRPRRVPADTRSGI